MFLLLGCDGGSIPLGDAAPVDSGTPTDTRFGDGADGTLTIDGTVSLDDWTSDGRSSPDVVSYRVTSLSGNTLEIDDAPSGLAAGDEVLVIDLQGTPTTPNRLGAYAFATLETVTGSLTLTAPIEGFADPAYHVILVQRVPHYGDVTLTSGSTLTMSDWGGHAGGVLAFRANGTVTLGEGATIDVSGRGYRGGDTGGGYNADGYQGESWTGEGDGGSSDYGYNQDNGAWEANGGGGGALVTGGGGEHAGGATPGQVWYESASAPEAGATYGDAELSALFFGSGGGGVWNDGSSHAGPGGDGGGILYVSAAALTGGGTLRADGETTTAWSQGNWTYGAGGGAGGTIWLQVGELGLAAGTLTATGGLGENTHERLGGDGGVGRIRVDCDTWSGAPCTIEALAGLGTPEVGAVGVP